MGTRRVIHYRAGKYRARFHNVWYWVFGLWTIEAMGWLMVALVWLAVAVITLVRTHHKNQRTTS